MKLANVLRRHLSEAKARLILIGEDPKGIVSQIRNRRLTYLSQRKMLQIIRTLREIDKNGIEGRILEAGCALGGSLVLIASYAPDRAISVYDTFEMIPAPGPEDPPDVHKRYATIISGRSKGIGGDTYYGYRGDLQGYVLSNVRELVGNEAIERIELYKGLLQDTMIVDEPVAFAHIDVDWYDPVKTCIIRIWPMLAKGGSLIFDDYFDWGGCKKAVDEYFHGRSDMAFDDRAGNMKVIKL